MIVCAGSIILVKKITGLSFTWSMLIGVPLGWIVVMLVVLAVSKYADKRSKINKDGIKDNKIG